MTGICPQLDALVANHTSYETASAVGRAAADEFFAKFDAVLRDPVRGAAVGSEFSAAEQRRKERAAGLRPRLQLLSPAFIAAFSRTRQSSSEPA